MQAIHWAAGKGVTHIVHLGDFGYRFPPSYVSAVSDALVSNDMTLGFIDGNHDNHRILFNLSDAGDGTGYLAQRLYYLPRGYRWTWNAVSFMAVGGAYSIDVNLRVPEYSWWSTETLTEQNIADCVADGAVDVMFCHDSPVLPPALPNRVLPESIARGAAYHRSQLDRIVRRVKPQTLWHGHYHLKYHARYLDANIIGLDCDGCDFNDNMQICTVEELVRPEIVRAWKSR